jgi:hypothetical protein
MILTEKINEIIELAIYSGYIKNEKPISLLLVASPEAGKSQVVMQYKENQGLEFITDATVTGLVNAYSRKLQDGDIKHLIFTDFITPMTKQTETKNSLISFLGSLIEEGVMQIHTYASPAIQDHTTISVIASLLLGALL